MIKPNLIWGLCLAFIIISFVGLIFLSLVLNKKKIEKFSFLNCFPYEIIEDKIPTVFSYLVPISLFAPLLTIIPTFSEAGDTAILNIVITCLFGISGAAIFAICKIKLTYPKEHIYCSTALLGAGFLMPALTAIRGFLSYSLCNRFGESGGVHIALAILSSIIAVAMLVIIFNPKLKNWATLESKIEGDQKVYIRPKTISLAYSEWISIAVIGLSSILFLLSIISY